MFIIEELMLESGNSEFPVSDLDFSRPLSHPVTHIRQKGSEKELWQSWAFMDTFWIWARFQRTLLRLIRVWILLNFVPSTCAISGSVSVPSGAHARMHDLV